MASVAAVPDDPAEAWDTVAEVGAIMTEAYGASGDVLAWWRARRKLRPVA